MSSSFFYGPLHSQFEAGAFSMDLSDWLGEEESLDSKLTDLASYFEQGHPGPAFDDIFNFFCDECKDLETHAFCGFLKKLMGVWPKQLRDQSQNWEKVRLMELICHYLVENRMDYTEVYDTEIQELLANIAQTLEINADDADLWLDAGCTGIVDSISKGHPNEIKISNKSLILWALFEIIKNIPPDDALKKLLQLDRRNPTPQAARSIPSGDLYQTIVKKLAKKVYRENPEQIFRLFPLLRKMVTLFEKANITLILEEDDLRIFQDYLSNSKLSFEDALEFCKSLIFRDGKPHLAHNIKKKLAIELLNNGVGAYNFTHSELTKMALFFVEAFPEKEKRLGFTLEAKSHFLSLLQNARSNSKVNWLEPHFRENIKSVVEFYLELLAVFEKIEEKIKKVIIDAMVVSIREQFRGLKAHLNLKDLDLYANCMQQFWVIPSIYDSFGRMNLLFAFELFQEVSERREIPNEEIFLHESAFHKLLVMPPSCGWEEMGVSIALSLLQTLKRKAAKKNPTLIFKTIEKALEFLSIATYMRSAKTLDLAGYQTRFYLLFTKKFSKVSAEIGEGDPKPRQLIQRFLLLAHKHSPQEAPLDTTCCALHQEILSSPELTFEDTVAILWQIKQSKIIPEFYFTNILEQIFQNCNDNRLFEFYSFNSLLQFYIRARKENLTSELSKERILECFHNPAIVFKTNAEVYLNEFQGFDPWAESTKSVVDLAVEVSQGDNHKCYWQRGYLFRFDALLPHLSLNECYNYWDLIAPLFRGPFSEYEKKEILDLIFKIYAHPSIKDYTQDERVLRFSKEIIEKFKIDASWLPGLVKVMVMNFENNPNFHVGKALAFFLGHINLNEPSENLPFEALDGMTFTMFPLIEVCKNLLLHLPETPVFKKWVHFLLLAKGSESGDLQHQDLCSIVEVLSNLSQFIDGETREEQQSLMEKLLCTPFTGNHFNHLFKVSEPDQVKYMRASFLFKQSKIIAQQWGLKVNKVLLYQYINWIIAGTEAFAFLDRYGNSLKFKKTGLNGVVLLNQNLVRMTSLKHMIDWCQAEYSRGLEIAQDLTAEEREEIKNYKALREKNIRFFCSNDLTKIM